ncbi:phage tail tape measure protein [Clostridium cadaveris]|nr:phage tail tape measure protein [Clostridium cadaveris]MDM8312910.1 phage tail tape measure protein [Clostridium cadaveris]
MSSITSGIRLAPLMVDIKADIKTFKDDMSKASVAGVAEAKKISKELSNVTKAGEKLSKAGTNLTKFVTVPLAGAGVAVGKMSMDFESSFAKVSTLLDSNVVDFNKYKKNLLKASDDSKVAVGEFSEAVYGSISAGVDQTKAIEFTTNAMKLAKGGFTDGAKAVDVLTTAINGYGLQAEDATRVSDLLITTQNLGKTTVDELASSMGPVIKMADNANFSIEELSAAYALMTKNGIATAESGTYLKQMLNEITKYGSITDKTLRELTGKGFADLKKAGKSTSEILSILSDYAEESGMTLKDMFGSAEAGTAAMMLATKDGKEYNKMLKDMETSAGATQQAFDKMDATPAEQLKGAINKLKNSAIQLGVKVIPVVTKITNGISNVADKFSNLSDEQQENILKWGGIALAAGPVIKLIGGGISTFVKIKSAIGGTSKALSILSAGSKVAATATAGVTTAAGTAAGATGLGALTTGLGGAVVAAAPFALAIGGVGLAAYGVHKALSEEVVPSVDLFADKVTYTSKMTNSAMNDMGASVESNVVKISDETKNAVKAYMDLDNETTKAMYKMKVEHSAVTEELANDMIGKFTNMGETIKASQKQKYDEMYSDTSKFLADNNTLTEEREAEILNTLTTSYNQQQLTVDQAMSRITEIYRSAKERGVEITQSEQQEINMLREQMRNQAITTLSSTEEEAAVIRERMKSYQGRLTAEMAAEMVQKANEARDGEINAANTKYDEVVRQAARLRQAGAISDEEYNNMVESAAETRDEQIAKAKEACDGVKNEIEQATPGISKQVEMQTGEIKKWYNKAADAIGGFFKNLFSNNERARKEGSELSNSYGGGGGGGSRNNVMTKNATGTPSWRGGLTMVHDSPNNDYGEIMDLPRGTRIYPHDVSMRMAERVAEIVAGNKGKESSGTNINFNGTYGFNNKADIDYFMNQAALKLKGVR